MAFTGPSMINNPTGKEVGFTLPTSGASGLGSTQNTAIDPIIQAALIQSQAIEQGIPFFEPFLEAGQQGLAGLQQGATVGGVAGQCYGDGSGDQVPKPALWIGKASNRAAH